MGNRNNRRKYKDIANHNKQNERITKYKAIKNLVKEHKFSRALSDIEKYIESYPEDCFGQLLYGTILSNINQLEQAKKVFERLVDKESKNMYTAMHNIACIERRQGNTEKAKEIFNKVINESPYEEDFSKVELAEMEEEVANFEKAEEILKTISKEHEHYAKLEIVRIKLYTNKPAEAFNIISTIREIDNDKFNRKLALEKGEIELAYNNYKDAREYFEQVLRGPKTNVYYLALKEMSKIDSKFGNYEKAIETCNKLLGNNDNFNNELYMVLGGAYEGKKDYDLARNYYLKTTKNKDKRRKEKGYFHLGILEFKLNNYDEAIEYFKKITLGNLYKRGAMYNMVHIEIRREDYKKAEIYLDKIVQEKFIDENEEDEYRRLRILIDKKLNKNSQITSYKSYGEKQYAKYSKEEAICHIKEAHLNNQLRNKSTFNKNIIIENLMKEMDSKLTEENLVSRDVSDVYCIEYEDIGYMNDNEKANAVRVITIPNTKDIITMYPTIKGQEDHKEKPKQKRLSQIEKFNKKYNLK